MIGFASVLPFAAIVPAFVQVTSWPLFAGFFASVLAMVAISYMSYRRGHTIVWLSLTGTFVVALLMSRFASPFVLTPVVVCAMACGLTAIPWLLEHAWVVGAWVIAALATPFALEKLGVFASTWGYDGAYMQIGSTVVHGIDRTMETIVLVAAQVVFVAAAGLFVWATQRDHRNAERRLHVQAWHLRQLLP